MNKRCPVVRSARFSLFLVILFLAPFLQGQDAATPWRLAEAEQVLLQNSGDLLPLKKLDTLRPAALTLWMGDHPLFESVLTLYQHTAVLQPDEEDIEETARRIQAAGYNLLIAGVNAEAVKDAIWKPGAVMEKLFTALNPKMKVVLVIFGKGELWRVLNIRAYADAVIYVPEMSETRQSVAAQAVYGATALHARLKEDLSGQFPSGAGFDAPGGLRLGYGPPELVGLNGLSLRDSLRRIVNEGIRSGAYPGAELLVARNGKVVFREAFGYYTYDSTRPVTLDDLYDFASVTKVTSALPAVMKLYGEDRFNLDAPFRQYVPYFKHSNKKDLTFREMLAHNARLRAYIPYWVGALRSSARYPWKKGWAANPVNNGNYRSRTFAADSSDRYNIRITDDIWEYADYKKKIYKAIRKSPLNEKPGYLYSGLLFLVIPDMIEEMEGVPFDRYVADQFYKPLGAYTLGFNPARRFPVSRMAPTEIDTSFRHLLVQGYVHDEAAAMLGGVSGNAGLFGNADDLAKLVQMYMNEGAYGGEQLIAAKALREFTRCQYCDEGNHRGLGFDKPLPVFDPARSYSAKDASPASFGHSGFTGTYIWGDPESGILIVFLSNRVYPSRDRRGLYQHDIRQRLHQSIYDARMDK